MSTANHSSLTFGTEEVTWEQIRTTIKEKNQELYEIIENINPNQELTFIKASYPFGAKIIDHGKLYLPTNTGKNLSIQDDTINKSFREKLQYSPIPLGLLLNKASDVYLATEQRDIPLIQLSPGNLFGIFEITSILSGITPEPRWCISSGSRFMFMLPNIDDEKSNQRLNATLGTDIKSPKSFADHNQIFIQLATQTASENTPWHSEVLFFTDKWFERPATDSTWAVLYNYLFKYNTLQIGNSYKDPTFELIWKFCEKNLGNNDLNLSSYLISTIKHLIAIATGVMPGFCNADTKEEIGPTKLIQDIYTQIYQLENQLPTLMHPYHQTKGQIIKPSYYSLSFPTLFDCVAYPISSNILADLEKIKSTLDYLFANSNQKRTGLPKAYSLLDNVQYTLFHKDSNSFETPTALGKIDSYLEKDKKRFPERELTKDSEFYNGCIQIFSCLIPNQKYAFTSQNSVVEHNIFQN